MSSHSKRAGSSREEADSDYETENLEHATTTTVLRDRANWLVPANELREKDIILLFTPLVSPIEQGPNPTDPFQSLGLAIARRHGRVRHVPFSQRIGLNSTHLGFIQRCHRIIFCLVPVEWDLQLTPAEIAFNVREDSPFILVLCSNEAQAQATSAFPTVIRSDDYSESALEAVAALLFERQIPNPGGTFDNPWSQSRYTPGTGRSTPIASSLASPRLWPVEEWNEARDISGVWSLWTEAFEALFVINQGALSSLLRRPGYAKHYVVRRSDGVLGFCATYLSYIDRAGENLIASIAILVVHPLYRQQGIGLSLHSHSISALRRTRGIIRLQLGSTFPRLFYGPPVNMSHDEWFRRRGWRLDKWDAPGKGHIVCDLLLDIADWRVPMALPQSRVVFRLCVQEDMHQVLQIVENTPRMCWFDQYSCLMNGANVEDIVLATVDNKVIAVALTYTPSCGSQVAANLPWASQIGDDVGGITCICISRNLQRQGMRKMFLDGVMEGLEHLKNVGFREWAVYRDVWKDVV